MRVGIVGAGLIGKKRGVAALADGDSVIEVIADVDLEKAKTLASELGAKDVTVDWETLTKHPNIDAVIITTPNHLHAPIAINALKNNKHVLCEKPLATLVNDAETMVKLAESNKLIIKTGFNHRHFSHIWKAKELCDAGVIGDLMYIRGHYGHGGRAGYDKEWRGNVKLSGGGELMDQGFHMVDLCRWFLGDFSEAYGFTRNYNWGTDTIEDNAFFTLSTAGQRIAHIHVSWTEWKNDFSFEIFGKKGYLKLKGLTGYYGIPKLILGVKADKSVVPEESYFEFPNEDISFCDEWREFKSAILEQRRVLADGVDGLKALKCINAVYESNKTGKRVYI